MHLTVITPVGPGHEKILGRAVESVIEAAKNPGPFQSVIHKVVRDTDGRLGRGKARNIGMEGADWCFFLDADDEMMPDALNKVNPEYSATFGAVCVNGRVTERNLYPCHKADLKVHGARGTLSMGFFYKGDLRFNEDMIAGEDFDFYMRLPDFIKGEDPLVSIGRDHPSAGGPKGYDSLDWQAVCRRIVDAY